MNKDKIKEGLISVIKGSLVLEKAIFDYLTKKDKVLSQEDYVFYMKYFDCVYRARVSLENLLNEHFKRNDLIKEEEC